MVSSRSRRIFGDFVLTCFIVVQFADWAATFHGLSLFGTSAEGNHLLRFLMERYDIILVLTTAKLFATIAGSLLHFVQRHLLVAVLTLIYLVCAVFPWMKALNLSPIF